jgi:uncharacterized protein YndB with AHSA1/START domain
MTQQTNLEAVQRSVTVNATQAKAFEVFTTKFGSWWPKDYSISPAGMADFVMEPKVGGRWYELSTDGTEYDTGRVLAYDPPERVVFAWHLDAQFAFDPDPDHASEVEVRFIAEGEGRTRVELEHRAFERHVDAEGVRTGVDGGWSYILDLYAAETA